MPPSPLHSSATDRGASSELLGAAAVALLPVLMWLCSDGWIWDSTSYFDTNVYVGYFRHYLEQTSPYVDNYKSSRLPFILPGVALYALLPPAAAHHALFFLFHGAASALLYVLARRRCGPHAALAVGCAYAAFTFLHAAPSYHNQATAAYVLLSLVLLERPRRAAPHARAAAAGAAYALAFTTNTVVVALFPVLVLHALAALRPDGARRLASLVAAGAAGGAAALAAFGLVNVAVGGPFLFFLEQLRYSSGLDGVSWSKTPTLELLSRLKDFPHLTLPAFVLASSTTFLLVALARRRIGPSAFLPASLLLAAAAAIAMQAGGKAVLEIDVLFAPFFVPVFLAAASLVGDPGARDEGRAGPGPGFVLVAVGLAALPLVALGAVASRALVRLGATWPFAATGMPFSLAAFAVAVVACVAWRRRPAARALAFLCCFAVLNLFRAGPHQPAYVYQWDEPCSFRRDVFEGVIEADLLMTRFDPENVAASSVPGGGHQFPLFDGSGWCTRLPIVTVVRSFVLSRHFMTTQELLDDFKRVPRQPRPPPTRIVVGGHDDASARRELRHFERALPKGARLLPAFDQRFEKPTYSVVLRGFTVELPP